LTISNITLTGVNPGQFARNLCEPYMRRLAGDIAGNLGTGRAIHDQRRRAVDKVAEVLFTNVHKISAATENQKVN
jgi:tRNA U55 pseudouridine synthase TruB